MQWPLGKAGQPWVMKSHETGLQAENDEAVQQLGRAAIGTPAIHT